MKFLIILLLTCCCGIGWSQPCKEHFVDQIIKTFEKKQKKHVRIAEKEIKKLYGSDWQKPDSIKYMPIPMILFSKSVKGKETIDSTSLLCYLDGSKIYYDDIYVHTNSTLIGCISFLSAKQLFRTEINIAVFDALKKIKPDYVFRIGDSIFYCLIKNGELYVLESNNDNQQYMLCSLVDFMRNRMLISTNFMRSKDKEIVYPRYWRNFYVLTGKIIKEKQL